MQIKEKVLGGLFWTFSERFAAQIVSTIVAIILARILNPEYYGIISIVMVFMSFCEIFVSSSFGKSIVQKENADTLDYNTALFLSLILSTVVYLLCFFISPLIAIFFNESILNILIRIMAIRIPIGAFNNIQQAYIQKNMQFRKFFVATLIGTVISGILGIIFAYLGFEIWALVIQYLSNAVIDTIILLIVSNWKPKLQFNFFRAKAIFLFGWKLIISDIVDNSQRELSNILIGKIFGTKDLAFYEQGNRYPKLFVNNMTNAVGKVMLPIFSENQKDNDILLNMLRKSVRLCIYIMAPIMIGFAAISTTFISLVLTNKWLPCVPFIQIFCISYLTRPLETFCHQAILAKGRSDIILRISVTINIVSIISILFAVFWFENVFLIAVGTLISTLVSMVCYLFFSNKMLGYKFKFQIKDILPSILISIVMGICVNLISTIDINKFLLLIIQIIFGVIIYIILSIVTRNQEGIHILNEIKKLK